MKRTAIERAVFNAGGETLANLLHTKIPKGVRSLYIVSPLLVKSGGRSLIDDALRHGGLEDINIRVTKYMSPSLKTLLSCLKVSVISKAKKSYFAQRLNFEKTRFLRF